MLPNEPLTREHIEIDPELIIEDDGISAYIETWFDVDEKFSVNTRDDDSKWVNFYAVYNPDKDSLKCFFIISSDDDSTQADYAPLTEEVLLIKTMINEKCLKENGYDLATLWAQKDD